MAAFRENWKKRFDSYYERWKKLPASVRKPVVMVIGCLFIVAAALTGWLPGPGGIPLFLVGIAILATEFDWAQKVRDVVLQWVHNSADWLKAHKLVGSIILLLAIVLLAGISYTAYTSLR